MSKRAFDFIAALLGLALLSPLLVLVALLIKLESRGPALFRQERIGRGFRPFRLYKFGTMVHDAPSKGGPLTFDGDPRITRLGRVLRKTKIDELPQLINVLHGEMSFVDRWPEVRPYVELFREDYQEFLQVVPGITDLASVQFRHEAETLGRFENPEAAYVSHILPDKIKLAKAYVRRSSLGFDIALVSKTLCKLFS